jgi:amino acid permease
MTTIILTSIFSASLIYELVAILGYLSFGSRVTANIIAMYPSTTLFIAGGQLAIVVLVMFSYPLQVHPCRICLDKVVLAIFDGNKETVQTAEEEIARHEENSEDEDSASDADHDDGAHDETTLLRHILLTAAIVIPGFAIAYFVDSLQRGELPFLSGEEKQLFSDPIISALVCGIHWLNRDQLHPTRALLLETIQG